VVQPTQNSPNDAAQKAVEIRYRRFTIEFLR